MQERQKKKILTDTLHQRKYSIIWFHTNQLINHFFIVQKVWDSGSGGTCTIIFEMWWNTWVSPACSFQQFLPSEKKNKIKNLIICRNLFSHSQLVDLAHLQPVYVPERISSSEPGSSALLRIWCLGCLCGYSNMSELTVPSEGRKKCSSREQNSA